MYSRDKFFTAQQADGKIAVMRQPAGCLTAHVVTTLPLSEAIRATNALNRTARECPEVATARAQALINMY